jgi:NAD(P)-dependent dehydrogenase (short-subunit alcohol dehydrogenase family)
VEANIKALLETVGTVDHIVLTASGKPPVIPIEQLTLENMQVAGLVRFLAAMLFAKVGSKRLSPGPASPITFTSAMFAKKPMPNWSLIAVYSAGAYGMAKGSAADLKPIRVNIAMPAAVGTSPWQSFGMPQEQLDALMKATVEKHVTGGFGHVEDLVEAYLYAMRDGNVTGSIILHECRSASSLIE